MAIHLNILVRTSQAFKGRHMGVCENDITDMFEENGGAQKMLECALWDQVQKNRSFVFGEVKGTYGILIDEPAFQIDASGGQEDMYRLMVMIKRLYLSDGCDLSLCYKLDKEEFLIDELKDVLKER